MWQDSEKEKWSTAIDLFFFSEWRTCKHAYRQKGRKLLNVKLRKTHAPGC